MNLKKTFIAEVRDELLHKTEAPDETKSIHELPLPVQKHFIYCGFSHISSLANARLKWEKMQLYRSPESRPLDLNCLQYNFAHTAGRYAYMNSKGGIPMEGYDRLKNGKGELSIRLFKFLNISNATGPETDQSELVTLLAEALLIPSIALQPYITWEAIDELSTKARIIFNGVKASGVFYFSENGSCRRFITGDRFMMKNKRMISIPWSVDFLNYALKDGIMIPSQINAVWHTAGGDFEYVKGWISGIEFNVNFTTPD